MKFGRIAKPLTTLAMALLLCSCAARPVIEQPPVLQDYLGADAAQLVVAIGVSKVCQQPMTAALYLRRIGTDGAPAGESGRMVIELRSRANDTPPDYDDEAEMGGVAIASVPPGMYELTNLEMRSVNGMIEVTDPAFSIQLRVRPKTLVYLGNFQIAGIPRTGVLGVEFCSPRAFVLEDKLQRDITALMKRRGGLMYDKVNATPDLQGGTLGLVFSRQAFEALKQLGNNKK